MSLTICKGTFELSVSQDNLKLVLKIIPSPQADDVTPDVIRKKMTEMGIRVMPDKEAVETLLTSAMESMTACEAVIAEGQAPLESSSPEIKWSVPPIPVEIESEADEVLHTAPEPEIYRVFVEKEKVERVVDKKSLLPIGGSKKQETIIEYRKVQRQERVHVNLHLVEKGYAEEGTLLGEIGPVTAGSPGKDLFGARIAAEDSHSLFAGSGVQITRGEIKAVASGFVRRGFNWIDILPWTRHRWDVFRSEDHQTFSLEFYPGTEKNLPDAQAVLDRAGELGADPRLLVSCQEILHMMQEAVLNKQNLEAASISTSEDSFFLVESSVDKLQGLLTIRKRRGNGHPLVLKEVGAAIKTSGFKRLDFDKIRNDILEFQKGPEAMLDSYVLCEGAAPTRGEDMKLELDLPFLAAREKESLLQAALEADAEQLKTLPSLAEFPLSEIRELGVVVKDAILVRIAPATKGENGMDVFGMVIPGIPGDDLDIAIYEHVVKKQDLLVAAIDGILDYSGEDGYYRFRVRPYKDARIEVAVADDRMSASVCLWAHAGTGKRLSLQMMQEALEAAGVVYGIDNQAILDALQHAEQSAECKGITVARGTPAVNPGEGRLEFRIQTASGKGVSIGRDGRADFRRQDRITTVEKGTLLAEYLQTNEEGREGVDVNGKPVPFKHSKADQLVLGTNVEEKILDDGSRQFYAAVQGELFYQKNRLEVRSVLNLGADVDMKTGNIKFPGDVRIKGAVRSGFVVFSDGDIDVGEGVEAALVSAEGSIRITGGIKGAAKAVLRSRKQLYATFAEQASILAVEDVCISNSCLRCNVKTNERLVLDADKAVLMGGTIKARQGVDVQNLGSSKGAVTHISFGQNYLIQDRIEVEEKAMTKHKEDMTRLEVFIKNLEKEGSRDKLEAARREKLKYLKLIEKRSMRLFTLREKFEEHFGSEVIIRGSLYPGVVFESHGRYYEPETEKKALKIVFDQATGRIVERALGSSRPERSRPERSK